MAVGSNILKELHADGGCVRIGAAYRWGRGLSPLLASGFIPSTTKPQVLPMIYYPGPRHGYPPKVLVPTSRHIQNQRFPPHFHIDDCACMYVCMYVRCLFGITISTSLSIQPATPPHSPLLIAKPRPATGPPPHTRPHAAGRLRRAIQGAGVHVTAQPSE